MSTFLKDGDVSSLWLFVALVLVVLIWAVIRHKRLTTAYLSYARQIQKLVAQDEHYFGAYFGKSSGAIGCILDIHTTFWADCTYSVVIARKGKPVAVIGFEIDKECMHVRQLQGIKGANLHGLHLGEFLLPYAERIARALRMETLAIESAHRLTYFEPANEESALYRNLYAHQNRLRDIYNRTPEVHGYEKVGNGKEVRHHVKRLRKRLTFERWVRLQILLHGRMHVLAQKYFPEAVAG